MENQQGPTNIAPQQSTPDIQQPPNLQKRPRSKNKIFFAVGFLILLSIGMGVAWTQRKQPESPPASAAQPVNSELGGPKTEKSIKITVVEEGKLILPNGYADPTIIPTDTGYRMYVNRQSGGPSGYNTFTSNDGIAWEKEKDMVIPGVATGRAVVLPTGIRIYYPGPQPINPTDPPADMFSSFSSDGVSFSKDEGIRLKPRSDKFYVEGPTVFQLPDKSWRMYFNENTVAAGNQRDGEIWGAYSKDGLSWRRDAKPTIQSDDVEAKLKQPWKQVLHPFVIKNPAGGYLMFYNSHSEIFAATSTDGITWEKLGQVGIHGADVDGYFQKDGSLRIYYGDFGEQTGGVVYSAVLKLSE